jgi:hypothetical protein
LKHRPNHFQARRFVCVERRWWCSWDCLSIAF